MYCRKNNVHLHHDETWKYIIEKIIQLPISEFKLYTDEGDYVTTCTYENDTDNKMCKDIIATVPPGDGDTFATPCIATSLFANTSQDFLIAAIADTTDGQSMHNQQLSVSNLEEPSAVPLKTQCHQLPATVSKPCTLHVSELKTKLCRATANCTGLTDELKGLDNLRHKLKTEKKNQHLCALDIDQHNLLVANMKRTIVKLKRDVQTSLHALEKSFYTQHSHIPTMEQDSPVWFDLSKQLHYMNKLLFTWKSETA